MQEQQGFQILFTAEAEVTPGPNSPNYQGDNR